jgi:hypothetical protein
MLFAEGRQNRGGRQAVLFVAALLVGVWLAALRPPRGAAATPEAPRSTVSRRV